MRVLRASAITHNHAFKVILSDVVTTLKLDEIIHVGLEEKRLEDLKVHKKNKQTKLMELTEQKLT